MDLMCPPAGLARDYALIDIDGNIGDFAELKNQMSD